MLYLAEVQKKTGFIGSGKTEFSLLACQRGEQSWSSIPGEEIVPAPDDASYNAGALVMVELSNNRQVQRHYEAGRSLVSILQGFSNLSKKFRTQEEEIEQWKQSLTFQSQELNRREMELESRQEQLEQAEADLEQLEHQQQELVQARQALEQAQSDLERKNQELEGAWAHLHGENRRLEERQEELANVSGLDEHQVDQLRESLNQLTGALVPTESMREPLQLASDAASHQHQFLEDQRQQLSQLQLEADRQKQALEEQTQTLNQRWEEWHQAEEVFMSRKAEAKLQQQLITAKQDRIQALTEELRRQGNLHQQVYELLNSSDKVRLSKKVNVAKLEGMALDELQQLVSDLERDLEKVSHFVSDQEEELDLQQQAINELKDKINQANEFDRLQLEAELADEQDRYQMLNETLVGQRRNLLEREEILSQHKAILLRRQGLAADETPVNAVNLEPLLDAIDAQRQQTNEAIHDLETKVKQMQEELTALKSDIDHTSETQAQTRDEIRELEMQLAQERTAYGTLCGRISLYEETLPDLETQLNQYQEKLTSVWDAIAKIQEASDYQLQAITEMRQTVQNLVPGSSQQEVAAS